jgi:hypothetical protein
VKDKLFSASTSLFLSSNHSGSIPDDLVCETILFHGGIWVSLDAKESYQL